MRTFDDLPRRKAMSDSATVNETLRIIRVFDAPCAKVFNAWLNREEWQSWIGPEGISCEVPLLEPWVGGRYRIGMRLSDGRMIPVAGVFKTIDAPRKLVFTWGWEGDGARESLITVTLREIGNKTELTLQQDGLGSAANRDDHGKGWTSAFNKLAVYLAQ
jgi:uncharacterized protein YndB with AHSA1/START domain